MSVLMALATLYDRMQASGDAPPPGHSIEKIGGEVVLDGAGNVLAIRDLRVPDDRGKPQSRRLAVPSAVIRTAGIKPNLLWDKTAYVLGVTALKDDKGKPLLEDGERIAGQEKRTLAEHAAFVSAHEDQLAEAEDEGLRALLAFLANWAPEEFAKRDFRTDLLDENLVFRLEGDTGPDGQPRLLHDRPAARALLAGTGSVKETGLCLVTGEDAPLARLHPAIKGVQGAQSSGASLVSFNLDAFTSYGKEQGENAPVSEAAAFAYGTALNALLARGSNHSLRIGDTTVAFWAETPDPAQARTVDAFLLGALNPPDEADQTARLRATLESIAAGRGSAPPEFAPETRVFILGLAPNAARLSLRFWRPGTLGDFARNITRFWDDLALEPPAWSRPPAAWSLLYETAIRVGGKPKADTIPPRLGGDLMRAVLSGGDYPRTLLAAVVQRIRADGEINARRAAICAAFIRRNLKQELAMSLDRHNPDPAYRLGRLFAVLEGIQKAALPGLSATIRDRYFGAASATPARVFPLLIKNATHHLSLLRKGDGGGLGHWFDAEMGEIWSALPTDLPRALPLEDQARFIAGYYHQRWAKKAAETADETIVEAEEPHQ